MSTIVHFDLSADNPERAQRFYGELFGWKFSEVPGPTPYYLIETTDLKGNKGLEGGMAKREKVEQGVVNYIGVSSLDDYIEKVKKLHGKVIMAKTAVPGWGYLAVYLDTEGNTFGLWEDDENAKG